MYIQFIQNSLLWWSKKKWLYYISLGALIILAALLIKDKVKSKSIYALLFVLAVYFDVIAYAFILLFHRVGLSYRSSRPEDRDALVDGQLVVNVAAIMMPLNYILYCSINSYVRNDISSSFIAFFLNAISSGTVFRPISQLLEKEYAPEKRKMLGIIIWVLSMAGVFVFWGFPTLNEALSRIRVRN